MNGRVGKYFGAAAMAIAAFGAQAGKPLPPPTYVAPFAQWGGSMDCPNGVVGALTDLHFDAVSDAINAATFTNESDRENLLIKLSEGWSKVMVGKNYDADMKLDDIVSAATKLASSTKKKLLDASDINNKAALASACLGY